MLETDFFSFLIFFLTCWKSFCYIKYVVSNGSKILIWKQITTIFFHSLSSFGCFQWFKDTNLKANHNIHILDTFLITVVSNGSKILIWKQITTLPGWYALLICCFQWFKDTNLKANHNDPSIPKDLARVVSNGSKILIWKQITTVLVTLRLASRCFQWFKDTNLKANHNGVTLDNVII